MARASFRILAGLAPLAFLLSGCAPRDTIQMTPGLPSTQLRACAAAGGFIAQRGKGGRAMCVHPYADAGKACRTKTDCLGRCIADKADGLPQAGEAVAGRCEPDDKLFGCYAEVHDGKARPAICVD